MCMRTVRNTSSHRITIAGSQRNVDAAWVLQPGSGGLNDIGAVAQDGNTTVWSLGARETRYDKRGKTRLVDRHGRSQRGCDGIVCTSWRVYNKKREHMLEKGIHRDRGGVFVEATARGGEVR